MDGTEYVASQSRCKHCSRQQAADVRTLRAAVAHTYPADNRCESCGERREDRLHLDHCHKMGLTVAGSVTRATAVVACACLATATRRFTECYHITSGSTHACWSRALSWSRLHALVHLLVPCRHCVPILLDISHETCDSLARLLSDDLNNVPPPLYARFTKTIAACTTSMPFL